MIKDATLYEFLSLLKKRKPLSQEEFYQIQGASQTFFIPPKCVQNRQGFDWSIQVTKRVTCVTNCS